MYDLFLGPDKKVIRYKFSFYPDPEGSRKLDKSSSFFSFHPLGQGQKKEKLYDLFLGPDKKVIRYKFSFYPDPEGSRKSEKIIKALCVFFSLFRAGAKKEKMV
ncbi:hypothetical protein V5J73_11515 [Flavobacterium sp. KS-LB2]|uniref:hypothetical protein n=1 Tax=Flavobacterium sp. KS-LB2 TaxID=3120525 RepID=UPI0030CFFB93